MKNAKDINKVLLAEIIVDQYSYEELYQSALNGTYEFLNSITNEELLEQADLVNYWEVI